MHPEEPLRVMSFNVRQMDGNDGPNDWEHRKDLLVETIRKHRPHLMGTQEIFAEQAEFIRQGIPELSAFGSGRFGDSRDKHNSIFFDARRLSLIECGDLWFSLTPSVPGSADWGIPRPRMVTWGRLRRLDGKEILMLNTHMPYGRGAEVARHEATRVVLQAVAQLPADLPLFLTGDFNAAAGSDIYEMLTEKSTPNLRDAWKTAARTEGPEGTLNGFGQVSPRFADRRIDWILHRNAGATLRAETITRMRDGIYPSDHYPVCAEFSLA